MAKLYVAGFGPGAADQMTIECRRALENSDLIAGYTLYVDLIKELFPGRETLSTPMMGEADRCRKALAEAEAGKTVCLVCSGDSGVYGMASLVYELSADYSGVDIEIVPGVTAALSGSALLGAALSHDFAVLSLSDLLTPWELIEKRLRAAAMGDFSLCIYNPSSKKRADYLSRACEILLEYKSPETVCGIARNIGRQGERGEILSLAELQKTQTDMFCTIFIGSSQTRVIDGKMVTPRGYRDV